MSIRRLAGLAAWLGFTGAAQAAIIYSGVVNLTIPNTSTGLYVNVVDGSTFTGPGIFPGAPPSPGSNYDFNIFGTTTYTLFSPGTSGQSPPTPVPTTSKGYVAATPTGPASNLPFNTLIGPGSTFNTGTPSASSIAIGQPAIFGFRFRHERNIADPNDDTVHFGWAQVNMVNGQPGLLIDYAWEDTVGGEIGAGVIPEPGSLAVLSAGIALLRRRR